MRAVFIGTSSLALITADLLLRRGHEVVLIEQDKEVITSLSTEFDCGYVHGDGSKPHILRELEPGKTDILFCLTGNDQSNIIASLVGRSLGFARVVPKIDDPAFEHICLELGLEDTIIPVRTTGLHLADLFEGLGALELSTMIRDEGRVFSFVAREEDSVPVGELDLPETTRVVCAYRQGKLLIPEDQTKLKPDDEVVLITHRKNIPQLEQRWLAARDNQHQRSDSGTS